MRKALFSIGAIQVLIILVNMARSKVLSMYFGPATFGIVSTIDQVVLSVVQLAGLGFPFFSLKFLSLSHSENHHRFQSVYVSFLGWLVGLSLLATILVLALISWKPSLFGADLVPYQQFLMLALLGVPSAILGIYFVHVLAASQMPSTSSFLSFTVTLCLSAAGCIGALQGGIEGLYIGVVSAGVITTLASLLYIGKKLHLNIFGKFVGIFKEFKRSPEVISFSLLGYFALSTYSIAMLVTRYCVFSRLGDEQAGFLQAVLAFALALGAVSGPMSTLYLTPKINRGTTIDEKLNSADDFQKNIIFIVTILALPILLFPKLALTILFSAKFIPTYQFLYLFVLWQCLYQIVNVYRLLLVGLDDVFFFSMSTSLGYGVVILLSPDMIESYGLNGAALALISGIAFSGLLTICRLRLKFKYGLPFGVWLRISFCLSSIFVTGHLFNEIDELSQIGLAYRGGFLLIFMMFIWLFMTKDQKDYIFQYKQKQS